MSPPVLGAPQRGDDSPAPTRAPAAAPVSAAAPAPQRRDLTEEELVKLPIQALLVRSGVLTIDQLSDALRENVASGTPVEDVVVRRGWVDETEITRLKEAKVALTPAPAPAPEPAAPEPAPEVAPPPVQPQPVAEVPPQQPTPPAPAPVAQPQPLPPPAPEPVPVYQPVAPLPVQTPEPDPQPEVVLYVPQPPPPPMHVAPPAPTAPVYYEQPDPEAATVGVFLRLSNGERIWAGRFPTMEAAEQQAQQLIHAVVRPEPGQWLRHGDRFVRPEAVVSVELSRRRED